jgi:hypothetical protein
MEGLVQTWFDEILRIEDFLGSVRATLRDGTWPDPDELIDAITAAKVALEMVSIHIFRMQERLLGVEL